MSFPDYTDYTLYCWNQKKVLCDYINYVYIYKVIISQWFVDFYA